MKLESLNRLKLKIFVITAIAVFLLEVYYYFSGVSLSDCIKDWLMAMVITLCIIEYGFRIIKRDRKELETLKNFITDVIENVNCGIVVVDKDLTIKLWNKYAENCYKIKKRKALNKNIKEFFDKNIEKIVKNVIKTGKIKEVDEIKIGNKTYNIKIRPLRSSDNVIGACLCIIDLTKRVKEKKELEELLRIKEIFVDILSHDLLNVVTVIKGMIRLAKEEKGEELKEILEAVERNTERLEGMIENASKYAKLERIGDLVFQEKNLREIIEKIIKNFEYVARKKDIQIIFKGEDVTVKVHESIVDLISNLLSNALKYSPQKSKVVIGLKDENNKVLIYVKDYGAGIPDKYKKSIFERFTRLKKEGVKGSGLGLAIVKRIAKIHKGRVWVEDNPEGKGSIFYVELPKNY